MQAPVLRLREQDLGDIPGFVEARRAQLAPLGASGLVPLSVIVGYCGLLWFIVAGLLRCNDAGMVKLVAPRRLTSVHEDFDMTIPAPIAQAVAGTCVPRLWRMLSFVMTD